jgi:hypothetical protein
MLIALVWLNIAIAVNITAHFVGLPLPDLIPPVKHYLPGPYDDDDTTYDFYYEEYV